MASPPDDRLIEALKAWRKQQAAKEQVRAFHVLSNRTVEAIASARPRNEDELAQVTGIGPGKLKKYGSTILGLAMKRS